MRPLLAVAALAGLAALAAASDAPVPWRHSGEIDWKVSGSLPPGAEYHLIYEQPQTHAVQLLVRFPKDYALPAHAHSHDETIFVVRGKLEVASGGAKTSLEPGAYAVFPAGTMHALKAKGWGGCEMLVAVDGPYDVKGLTAQ